MLEVQINGMPKPVYFRFIGNDSETKANTIKKLLEVKPSDAEIARDSLELEQLMKIIQLKDSEQLKGFFEDLVITKKKMTEEEFW